MMTPEKRIAIRNEWYDFATVVSIALSELMSAGVDRKTAARIVAAVVVAKGNPNP